MKLKDLNSEQSFDIVSDLIVYIGNIVVDDDFAKLLTDSIEKSKNIENSLGFGTRFITEIAKILFKKEHKEDVFGILSVMNEKSIEEIKQQSIVETTKQVKELLKDTDFMQLFLE